VKLLRAVATLELFALISSLGCQKMGESIIFIALHPTNMKIVYVAANDAVQNSRDSTK